MCTFVQSGNCRSGQISKVRLIVTDYKHEKSSLLSTKCWRFRQFRQRPLAGSGFFSKSFSITGEAQSGRVPRGVGEGGQVGSAPSPDLRTRVYRAVGLVGHAGGKRAAYGLVASKRASGPSCSRDQRRDPGRHASNKTIHKHTCGRNILRRMIFRV